MDLAEALDAVREALVLPFVRLDVTGRSPMTSGTQVPHLSEFALDVGPGRTATLVVGLRPGERTWSRADLSMIGLVAPLVATTVRAQLLAEQVSASRGEAVAAIEEERRRTLEKVRVRVHDIMGSRISMLQRLLTAPEPLEAAKLVPTVDMVLEEIWLEEESPQELLQDLVRAYEAFGVTVRLTGKLPERRTVALAFVEVLREAATNAICHGHADVIEVKVGEAGIRIADNGCGAPPTFHPGGGLSAIIRRAKSLDARLTIAPQPSFSLALTMPAPGRASEPAP